MSVSERIAVVALQREIVEANSGFRRGTIRSAAGDDHDAALPGEEQAVEETVYEHEMAEMIDEKVLLDTVDESARVAAAPIARVQYQHVDRRVQRPYRLGAAHDGVEIGELELQRRRLAAHAPACLRGPLQRPARADDPGAAKRKYPHRLEADPRGAAGYDGNLAGHVDAFCNCLGGRVFIEVAARHARGGNLVVAAAGSGQRRCRERGRQADETAAIQRHERATIRLTTGTASRPR